MTYNHKGINISITNSGKFKASVGEDDILKPSLKAMKDYIDKATKVSFEPVSMLVNKDWRGKDKDKIVEGTSLARVSIVDVRENKRSRYRSPTWLFVDSDGNTYARAFRDCEETIAAARESLAYFDETRRINDERGDRQEQLDLAIDAFAEDSSKYQKQA